MRQFHVKVFLIALLISCGIATNLHAEMHLTLFDADAIHAVFISDINTLSHEAPLIGTIEVTCVATDEVLLPDLRDRFQGFTYMEDFATGRTEAAGKACARWRFRLTPGAEGPWCLRPFVLTVRNIRTGAEKSLLTQRIEFPAPPPLPAASGAPEATLEPEWVAPGWKTISLWALLTLAGIALLAALWPLCRRIRRTLHERTLSPEARARLELDRLLAENLVAQGQFKRFYYGLTGVVRRYFERGYALRATRQTTQEFLTAIAADARVSTEERNALAQFLTVADAIKFAGIDATAAEAEAATRHVSTLLEQAATKRLSAINTHDGADGVVHRS